MSLLQAFEETIAGKEDRSGITAVDVYVSKCSESAGHSQKEKFEEALSVIDANLPDIERKWFLLIGVISRWNLTSEELSETIRGKLASDAVSMPPMAKYYALCAMGKAAGGLLPTDILNESTLRKSCPKLWAELFLSAYQNGNPAHITQHMIELLEGNTPLMQWKSLRALFPELRMAYGSVTEFRKQIQIIASELNDPIARKGVLEAADKRVGGGISDEVMKNPKKVRRRKHFEIPVRTIKRDIDYSQKYVAPDGQLAVAIG